MTEELCSWIFSPDKFQLLTKNFPTKAGTELKFIKKFNSPVINFSKVMGVEKLQI